MEKLPLYEEFKGVGKIMTAQISSGFRNGEWGWLLGYFVACLIVVTIGVAGVISLLGGATDHWQKWFPPPITVPLKTIDYQKVSEQKDEYGHFNTTYAIQIHAPFGNPYSDMSLGNFVPDAECLFNADRLIQEHGLGLASSTAFFTAVCTSEKPIIDTGELFRVKD